MASPLLWDCAQNEDLIGRACRLGRKVDGRILSSRVLQNYLIKASLLAKREAKKIKNAEHLARKKKVLFSGNGHGREMISS